MITYETSNGQISSQDFRDFVNKVKTSGSANKQVTYYRLKLEGDKRILLYSGLICLDEKCGCGGW